MLPYGDDEISVLGTQLEKFAASFTEPVYIGERPYVSATPSCAAGTATLLRLADRPLCVTCSHVLEEYRRALAAHSTAHFQIGNLAMNPLEFTIDEDSDLDLAVVAIPEQAIRAALLEESRFHQPVRWPPGAVSPGNVVSFSGFLGEWREQSGIASFENFSFTHAACYVHSVGEKHFYVRLELSRTSGHYAPGKSVPKDFGGLSGGSVFIWRPLHAELVGFLCEYQPSFDLLLVRSASVLRQDGKLKRGPL